MKTSQFYNNSAYYYGTIAVSDSNIKFDHIKIYSNDSGNSSGIKGTDESNMEISNSSFYDLY